MAGVHGATIAAAAITSSSLPPTTSAGPVTGKSLVSLSSLPSSFPSRRRRTNLLRQKILKTLENKPYPDIPHPQFPIKTPKLVIEETTQQQTAETDQLSLSQTTGFIDGIAGEFSTRSFVKIGLYLVGAFVFQSICAVLIFGWNDSESKDGNDHKNASVLDSKGNPVLLETKEGGMVLIDESEMDNRIMEIQEMARGARQQERLEAKRNGLVEEEDDDVDHDLIDKTLKEKEVDGRLMKLRKSLEGNYEKLTPTFPRKEVDNLTSTPLMFKKKYKYKSPSIDSGDKPKGFDATKDHHDVSSHNGDDILDISVMKDDNKDQEQVDESMNVTEPINKLVNGSVRANRRTNKTESVAGTSKEPKNDKAGKSNNLDTRKPLGFGQEGQSNGRLKGKSGNRKSGRNLGDMKYWWTSLPYVLGVLMQRGGGDNGEESEGLFRIRSDSDSESNLGLSHTVAFEDRGDATNFCHLLESFFQDLGDFSTHIIPIPTNELEEAVKSNIMKVVVMKKGQLELYVGQPLTDVESALRTLIQQTDNL